VRIHQARIRSKSADGGEYVAKLHVDIVGCVVLRWSDEPVWAADDGDADYLRRLAVRPAFAGKRIGEQMIIAAASRITLATGAGCDSTATETITRSAGW
jgi:GNAT superfamily N-acetyltransferase